MEAAPSMGPGAVVDSCDEPAMLDSVVSIPADAETQYIRNNSHLGDLLSSRECFFHALDAHRTALGSAAQTRCFKDIYVTAKTWAAHEDIFFD